MTTSSPSALAGFDNRDGWIWLDGALTRWRDATLHILTHGLHYGSAVFEGQRAYGGEIFKLAEHSERLQESARLVGFELPWTSEAIDRACLEVLHANALSEAYLRPIAWRGAERMSLASAGCRIHLAIAAWPWDAYFDEQAIRTGLRLDLSTWRRPPPDTVPTAAKAAGLYLASTLAADAAKAKGLDDALMLDWRGQVAEATGANIFFVKEGKLHTPRADCFLDGITRRTVIALAHSRAIEVVERAIRPEELEGFEQAFLTGSAAEVAPLASIGPWSFEVGDMTRQLRRDYLALVNGRLPNTLAA